MIIKRLFPLLVAMALAMTGLNAYSGNIDATAARERANSFLKTRVSTNGTINAPALSDLMLTHSEASQVKGGACDYYVFNIKGGGYIIIAGDDRANQVLGYSTQGHLDFTKMPDNLRALLYCYKEEIEYLHSHPALNLTPIRLTASNASVSPLIKSHWGQEMPYYLQCPTYQGEYCVVGCVATAMSQVMHYWSYPTSSPSISSYYCYDIGQSLPALPETNFNYDKMLNSYCHWDWDNSELIQDFYTEDQAQAVAKLARYCGQAVKMGYSPEGSGAYVSDQLNAMITFGYNSNAHDVNRDGWWGTYYSTAEWEAMIKTELDAGRPILYSANDPNAGGHAFVCDGYDNSGMFHFNFGWYGTCNGYYLTTALNMTHRSGEELKFNSSHEMLTDMVPPSYCVISTSNVNCSSDLMILGENVTIEANDVNILTTNSQLNVIFSLIDASSGGRKASTTAINIIPSNFEQGSTLSSTLKLPTTLNDGFYNLKMYYYITSPRLLNTVNCETGQLQVVGHLARYNSRFNINDVTDVINYLLNDTYPILNIDDVTALINVLLTQD